VTDAANRSLHTGHVERVEETEAPRPGVG
jgi:hypothetical protein